MYYTQPRYTKDIGLWLIPEFNKPEITYKALADFGAPLKNISPEDFNNKKMILQIGVAPIRIDLMMSVPGVNFKQAWKNRKRTKYGKTPIHIIGIDDLIKSKRKSGRPQDKLDLENLKQVKKK